MTRVLTNKDNGLRDMARVVNGRGDWIRTSDPLVPNQSASGHKPNYSKDLQNRYFSGTGNGTGDLQKTFMDSTDQGGSDCGQWAMIERELLGVAA